LSEELNELMQEKETLKEKIEDIEIKIEELLDKQKNNLYEKLNEPQNYDMILTQNENTLYSNIGTLSYVQDYITRIERRVTPRDIYILTHQYRETKQNDLIESGRVIFANTIQEIKEEFCKVYKDLNKSGLLNDAFEIFLSALTLLLSHNIPMALAAMIAGLIVKQGPKVFCKNDAHSHSSLRAH